MSGRRRADMPSGWSIWENALLLGVSCSPFSFRVMLETKEIQCTFPLHDGKGKGERPVSSKMSYAVASEYGHLLPVGSAICKTCRLKFSEALSTFSNMFSDDSSLKPDNSLQKESSKISDRADVFSDDSSLKPDNTLQKESKIFDRADLASQASSMNTFNVIQKESINYMNKDTDMMLLNSQSSQSSQFSSWSEENIPYTLDEINKAFSIITNGKFSPIKYQVRRDITSLKPSTLRSLKRKATTTVHEALDILAPDQSSKLLKLISSGKEPPCEPMLEELVIQIYLETSDRRVKHRLLSMITGSYSKKELQQKIPGLSTYAIDLARKNASSNVGKGIHIKRYDFSEAQSGKSYCDAKIAHMRGKIRKSVAEGNNVLTAVDMKSAIDDLNGVTGCQTAYVEIPVDEQQRKAGAIKGISKISNVEFLENGRLRCWKAYKVGIGKVISPQQASLTEIGDIVVSADFKLPATVEGYIKDKASESNLNSFGCPDMGCTSSFNSFNALHSHCLLGNHQLELQQASTYDKIKLRWYDACMNLSENSSRQTRGINSGSGASNESKGWALKKERKFTRFSTKVKDYSQKIFEDGEKSGRKANPSTVANNMRICRSEDGDKLFCPSEYLTVGQITSYFSRLAAISRIHEQRDDIEAEDLEATLAMIQRMEILQEISNDGPTSSES